MNHGLWFCSKWSLGQIRQRRFAHRVSRTVVAADGGQFSGNGGLEGGIPSELRTAWTVLTPVLPRFGSPRCLGTRWLQSNGCE